MMQSVAWHVIGSNFRLEQKLSICLQLEQLSWIL
jgi:hypothetical protein